MLTIRLSRVGKKNKPMYRLIISEKAHDPYGRALEILGSYNPSTKELKAKDERIKYWLSKGSQMSPTINNLLIEKGIIEGEKVKASKAKKKKKDAEKDGEENKEKAPAEGAEKPAEKTEPENKPAQAEEKPQETPVEDKKDEPSADKKQPALEETPSPEKDKESK
jgi:small subunit ribosomal protein S16